MLRAILANQRDRGMAGMEQVMEFSEELIDQRLRSETLTCQLKTLSQIVEEDDVEQIDLLKIDVQKSEIDVLQGISDEHWGRIKQLALEVHDIDGRVAALIELLQRRGYRVAVDQEDLYEGSIMYNVYGVQPA